MPRNPWTDGDYDMPEGITDSIARIEDIGDKMLNGNHSINDIIVMMRQAENIWNDMDVRYWDRAHAVWPLSEHPADIGITMAEWTKPLKATFASHGVKS